MRRLCVDKNFSVWKKYILDNEEALKCQLIQEDISYEYVSDTKVYSYGVDNDLQLGMWLQDETGTLRIYNRIGELEEIYWDHYEDDHRSGAVHKHNSIEIGYVVEGSALQEFFGEVHTFNEGDFWIVDRNCYHRDLYMKDNLLTVYLGIPSDTFDSIFLESIGDTNISQFLSYALLEQKKNRQYLHFKPKGARVKGGFLMEKLTEELIEQKVGFNDIVRGTIMRLLESLATNYEFLISTNEKQKARDLLFHDVEQYMHDRYNSVTIPDLVDEFHYNEDFYNRLIKEYTDFTYTQYLMGIRLAEAGKLLMSSDLSIEEIADKVGYSSRGHFYRLFTKKYGMTPAKYRSK